MRELPANAMDDYKNLLWSIYGTLSTDWHANHTARQTYISMSTAIVAAVELGINATPMEGFVNEQLDELLELNKQGLKSQLLLSLGYRDAVNDWNAAMKKYRKSKANLIVEIK